MKGTETPGEEKRMNPLEICLPLCEAFQIRAVKMS